MRKIGRSSRIYKRNGHSSKSLRFQLRLSPLRENFELYWIPKNKDRSFWEVCFFSSSSSQEMKTNQQEREVGEVFGVLPHECCCFWLLNLHQPQCLRLILVVAAACLRRSRAITMMNQSRWTRSRVREGFTSKNTPGFENSHETN